MSEEFQDAVVVKGAGANAAGGTRPVLTDSFEEGESFSRGTAAAHSDSFSEIRERTIPESVLAKIDALGKREPIPAHAEDAPPVDDEPKDEASEEAPAEVEAAPAESAEAEKPGEAKPADPPKPDERDERIARYEAANRKLVEDLEAERKRERPVATPHKLLIEAERGYLDDSNTSVRKFIAASLGVEDPNSAEVDAELAGLYQDLTAKQLGVSLDEAQQAKREAARTRQMMAREKRERKAESDQAANKATADADAKKADDAAAFIGNRIKADQYPLVHALSQDLDGISPGHVIWRAIERETKTGRIDPKWSDEQMIAEAAKIIETHYQALVDKVAKAKPQNTQPSTAKPNGEKPSAATTSASKDTRQSHGARTLTTADASVAPATPPAKKPAPKTETRPKFKSDAERKEWALRHLAK